jgi:hypothetical protein
MALTREESAMRNLTLPVIAATLLVGACASQSVEERLARDKPASKPSSCVQSTASRIPPSEECANAPGRSHSKEDLDQAAGRTMQEKLRVLDPAVGPH